MISKVTFDNPHRRKHFALFAQMEMPHFNIVAPLDVRRLTEYIKDHQLHFSGTMVYLLSKTANDIREFRWRIRQDEVVEHDTVNPSFTVRTDDSDVFSFCYVDYTKEYAAFIASVRHAQTLMRTAPSLEDEAGRDDYLFMSSFPWVHFTGFSHAMHAPARDSIPRFTWGKTKRDGDALLMPVGVQAHHGVVDGSHMGRYFELLGESMANPEVVIGIQ
jgi:chloramphenicol O-acetyltransferase type A